MNELDDFRSQVLARQIEAEEALIRGEAPRRMEMWSRQSPATLFSAGGESISGWDEIGRFFQRLAARISNGSDFSFDVEAAEVSGDLAYTVGFERFKASIAGGPVEPVAIRVTHVYRRENGEWKIVHRHGSPVATDEGFRGPDPGT